jgi:hypothetical protein
MNRLVKSALIAAGAALVTQAAQAQFANGDLVLGFTGGATDFVTDLGNFQSVVGVNGTSVMNLSSLVNGSPAFSGTYPGGVNGVSMGVVGGQTTATASFIYVTALRLGGAGNNAIAGSATPPSITTHSQGISGLQQVVAMNNSIFTGNPTSAGLSTTVARGGNANGYSWFNSVESASSLNGSYFQSTGYNADALATSGIIYEDLYGTPTTTISGAYNFSYKGFFTFDTTGGSPSLTFTPVAAAVPEPSTYGLIAGAGLLVICLRHRISQQRA